MTMVVMTALVWAAWYAAASLSGGSMPVRLVLAGLGASGQISVTSMVLGLTGVLTPGWLVGTNLALGLLIVGGALGSRGLRSPRRAGQEPQAAPKGRASLAPLAPEGTRARRPDRRVFLESLMGDGKLAVSGLRGCLGWETVSAGIVFIFGYLWLAAAAYFYPPRGVDDLVYHLPAVYQAVQDHRFQILPLALRKFFAFPFSADMPFLWIASLTRSIHWVGAAQIPFALLATLAVFSLGRRYGLGARAAALAALIFATMPVVLLQAASNYVDVVVNAWVLAGAVALLEYERAGRWLPLGLGSLAAGLIIGSKYQAIPFGAALIAIAAAIIVRVESPRARRVQAATLVAGIVAVSGSYWYLRNWIQFGNPFYPLPVHVLGAEVFAGDWPQGPSIWSGLISDPAELARIALTDPGLGTYNGGFGFLVWGFALPGLGLLTWHLRRAGRSADALGGDLPGGPHGRLGQGLILLLVPVGIAAWFLSPFQDLALTGRYVLSIGGFGLIGFGHLLDLARARRFGAATVLRGVGVLAAGASLCLAATARQPLLTLAPVAKDPPEVRATSSQHYLVATLRDLGQMSRCWAPLDAMTRAEGGGLSVYQAADFQVFWTAPTYGSYLQNRIWQFEPTLDREPDAYFFHSPRNKGLYLVKEIRQETVAVDPRYELVAANGDDETTLYVSRAALAERQRSHLLSEYYRRSHAAFVSATAASAASFEPGSVVVAPFPLAAGYLVHADAGLLRASLEPVSSKSVASVIGREGDKVLYTFGAPLSDRPSHPAGQLEVEGKVIPIYRNALPGARAPSGSNP